MSSGSTWISNAVLDRFGDHQVDEADDGRAVDAVRRAHLVDELDLADVGDRQADGRLHLLIALRRAMDHVDDLIGIGHDGVQRYAEDGADVVERDDIGGIRHRHDDHAVDRHHRDRPVAEGERFGDALDQAAVEVDLVQVDEVEVVLGGEGASQIER